MIKCACIGFDDKAFYFEHISGQKPIMGTVYTMEDATAGTQAQNRAFHSLLNAFYDFMVKTDQFIFEDNGKIYDFSTPSQKDFREFFKYKYGQGFTHIEYVDNDYSMVRIKNMEEIPGDILEDFGNGNKGRIKGVLKSWTDYTMKQRKDCIDRLFDVIKAVSCNDRKVLEIMGGMQGE